MEAEWEYACRGGATLEEECSYHFYSAKPTNDLSSQQANFDYNDPVGTAPTSTPLGLTRRVGAYAPNKLGLCDMHGNVWQWCDDLLQKGSPFRVIRGGSWNDHGHDCRAACRFWFKPSDGCSSLGVRLARGPSGGK